MDSTLEAVVFPSTVREQLQDIWINLQDAGEAEGVKETLPLVIRGAPS